MHNLVCLPLVLTAVCPVCLGKHEYNFISTGLLYVRKVFYNKIHTNCFFFFFRVSYFEITEKR